MGAFLHPVLEGNAAAQIDIIAATPHWRAIHILLLAGTGLVLVGLWARLCLSDADVHANLLAALIVIALGQAMNAVNIVIMTAAHADLAPALYDAARRIGLVAARFGNLVAAFGAAVLGWAEWRDRSGTRLLAWLAWLAAAAGFAGAAFFHESSRAVLAAVATLSAWQIAVAIRASTRPSIR